MNRIRHMIFAGVFAFGLAGCASVSAPPPPTASASERQAFLLAGVERVLERQQAPGMPGVALLVVKDGQLILARGKGMADAAARRGIDENTVFDVGSLTKPVTAIAVMKLAEVGRLSLGDSIGKWLPELSPAWHGVTIHHLLSHQSGLPDPMHVSLAQFRKLDALTNAELLARHQAGPLRFAPGSKAEYNNYNYILLAQIIARASGQSYAAYLKQQIFTPAGMRSTYVRGNAPDLAQTVALNYARNVLTYGITIATEGDTGVYSSVADLRRLIESLLSGQLVSQESLKSMTRAQSDHQVWQGRYGYGFFVQPGAAPLTIFAHTGEVDGYRSYVRVNLSKGVYYLVLSNGGKASGAVMNNLLATIQDAYDRDAIEAGGSVR